jgi:hypothetical protein
MNSLNEFLAKGLAFLVQKPVHKYAEARDYTPKFLSDMLNDSIQHIRNLNEVSLPIFRLCRYERYNALF